MVPIKSLSVWPKCSTLPALRRRSKRELDHLSHFRPSIQRRNIWGSSASDEVRDDMDPGIYEVIMPVEPPIWGTSHIKRLSVPESIRRPPYARPGAKFDPEDRYGGDPYTGDGRITQSGDELSVRKACTLAALTLREAGKHVKVSRSANHFSC